MRRTTFTHFSACLLGGCTVFCLCTPAPQTAPAVTYNAEISYQQQWFSGGSLTDESLLILPVLTASGADTTSALSGRHIGKLFQAARPDVEPVTKEEFETRYATDHDTASLSAFYRLLFKGAMVPLANSDSVWKEMKTAYCLATRVTNALTIRDFNGVVKRRMILETELWNVDSAEAVLRISVQASAMSQALTDAEFIKAALAAAFEKLPVFAPASNEQNW